MLWQTSRQCFRSLTKLRLKRPFWQHKDIWKGLLLIFCRCRKNPQLSLRYLHNSSKKCPKYNLNLVQFSMHHRIVQYNPSLKYNPVHIQFNFYHNRTSNSLNGYNLQFNQLLNSNPNLRPNLNNLLLPPFFQRIF